MTHALGVVRSREEFDVLREVTGRIGVSPRIIALTSALRLDGSSAQIEMATDLLTPEDIRTVGVDARRAAQAWYAPFRELLLHRGVDLGSVSSVEQLWFFRELLASSTAARRLLASEDFDELYLFSSDTPCLDGHRLLGTHGVSQAVFAGIFGAQGCRIRDLSGRPRQARPIRVTALEQRARRAIRRLLEAGSARGRRRELDRLASEVHGVILGFGEDFDLATIGAFLDAAGSLAASNASLIRTTSMASNVGGRTGLGGRLRDRVLDLSGALPPPERRVAMQLAKARRVFDAMCADGSITPSELATPGLASHLDHVWRRWVQWLVPHISAVDFLLDSRRPERVVIASAERARDRATAEVARNYGIGTLTIPHGYIGDVDAYDFNTDHFAAWGEGSKSVLVAQLRKRPETIHVVGAPQLRGIAPALRNPAERGSRLVLITSRITPACYDALDWNDYVATWKAIERFVSDHAGVTLVIKPHPGITEPLDFYATIVDRIGNRARLERDQTLESLAAETDAIACVIDPTTALLVSHLLEIPTVYIRTSWRVRPWAADTWGLPEGTQSIDDVSDVESVLGRLLWDDAFRLNCQGRGRVLVHRQLRVGTTSAELSACLGTP